MHPESPNVSKVSRIVLLLTILALSAGSTGCNDSHDVLTVQDPEAVAHDIWPNGDGSAYFNVMEAGFFSAAPPQECLATLEMPVATLWVIEGNAPVIVLDDQAEGDMPVVGIKDRSGFWRLLQAETHSRSGLHIALRDRCAPLGAVEVPELFGNPKFEIPDNFKILRGNSCQGEGRFGDLPLDHYWVIF